MNHELISVILAEDNPDHALLVRVVELPILGVPPEWPGQVHPQEGQEPYMGKRILVIDDQEEVLGLLSAYWRGWDIKRSASQAAKRLCTAWT